MLNKRKLVIISIAAVIVVAAIVTTVLFLTMHRAVAPSVTTASKSDPAKADPSKQEAQTTPDLSKDLGACTAVTKATVVTALGTKVKTVGDADNRGYAGSSAKGDAGSQTCVFALSSANTLNNRYSTTVTQFSTTDSQKVSEEAYVAMTKLDGIGTSAYFEAVDTTASAGTTALHAYNVYIFSGSKLYTLTLTQPTDLDAFTSTTAQAALTTIAKSITF